MPPLQFPARALAVERDLRIERAAQAAAQHFEAHTLSGLSLDFEVIADFGIRTTGHDAGDRHALGRRSRVVALAFHELRQVVDAEQPEVRHAAPGRQANVLKAKGRIVRDVQTDA